MEITIRKATINELKTIQDLNYKLFLWDFERDTNLNIEWPYQEAGENYFRRRITGEHGVCFVAERNGRIIGYVAGSVKKEIDKPDTILRSELENIYVEEDSRSKGAGKLLTEELIKWCKKNGAKSILVEAYHHNLDAIKFYENTGFRPYSTKLEKDL
ncbi:MAG: GNAT family N-acetyltransferase [Patescibacteria group bacterium]